MAAASSLPLKRQSVRVHRVAGVLLLLLCAAWHSCFAASGSQYNGVTWSSERWFWQVRVKDRGSAEKDIFCGYFETEAEAAKAADCAELALDQLFPPEGGQRAWRRNLPKETIYQDEVDALREVIEGKKQPNEPAE
eukprot:TRINITY_DN77073_c0_g1_i1.p1 TRINITY_DN77073_c0_g1~~TRINITY_DN77073_c0_g1_i1.p1  ORF type:complete len:143 (-),score=22.72 TRINITY_DN77073_c0_g1_i1:46-453(-)